MSETARFKQTFFLKAQSPLIHFQHEQWGATLRASEVKPRFDRFLMKKLGDTMDITQWYSGNKKTPSLAYKMHIKAVGGRKIDFPPELFYAEIKLDVQDKTRSIVCDCQMEIICFIPELMEAIKRYIAEFFIVTNFGRMQSKGFGSFLVDGIAPTPEEIGKILADNAGAKACYAITGYDTADDKKIFADIGKLYGVMKSGHNRREYRRSYLFSYCHEVMGIGNEKAAMKKEKVSPWDENGPVRNPSKKDYYVPAEEQAYHYVRALLGTGEAISYITGFKQIDNGYYKPVGKPVPVKIANETVERLASPILFKIIGDTVYMVAKRIPDVIYGQPFTFHNEKTHKEIVLTVPDAFDIDDFMEYFVRHYQEDMEQTDENGKPVAYSIGKKIIKLGE